MATRAVRPVVAFGDDAFEVAIPRELESCVPVALNVRTECQVGRCVVQKFLEQRFALEERCARDVHPVEVEHVEQRIGQLALALA